MAAWLWFTSIRFSVCFSLFNLARLVSSNLNQQLSIWLTVSLRFKSHPRHLLMALKSFLPKNLESQTIIIRGDDKAELPIDAVRSKKN